ncbi:troponin I, fast skeletal muscle-like [Synchiropus splendidus]|uniref:troponin I, fast skeletal muscle-like n=1 Tax=Synchiropus splendidus TaxID=270530 RepID=UPI00237EDB0A|nr:troponin I, fast skeletal muscle-like [Synchiropus splendidus]
MTSSLASLPADSVGGSGQAELEEEMLEEPKYVHVLIRLLSSNRGKKMTSSRRHHLKSLMLQIAASWIEQEKKDIEAAKEAYMAENCPDPDLSGDQNALMELCKKLQAAIDKIDEARYDAEAKVQKSDKEIEDLKLKVVELAGVKKPALKKVRMSADAMLQALLGGKHKVTMDLRANLKQVKKEVKEEPTEAVGDWRKNIEDKADRKKMFETS